MAAPWRLSFRVISLACSVIMKTKVEKKPRAEAVVMGTLTADDIAAYYDGALERIVKNIELPGFRRGKVPRERVLQEVGERSVWRDAAEEALKEQLKDILKEHNLVPILPPSLSLTVSEAQQDVPFTLTVVTPPTVEIGDHKKLVDTALKKLEKLDVEKERVEARKSLDAQTRAMLQIAEERALTDDEAKKLGFENAAALDHFLVGEAERAVENFENQRRRGAAVEALVGAANAEVPDVIVSEEARAMLESAKQEIARSGMPFNEYLEKRGMSEAEVIAEMRPQAEKRVMLDLIFAKIAQSEGFKPVDDEVHRVAHALMAQGASADRAHQYGAEVSIREQVWALFGLATPRPKDEPKPSTEPEAAVS